jgi:hypothetical protein
MLARSPVMQLASRKPSNGCDELEARGLDPVQLTTLEYFRSNAWDYRRPRYRKGTEGWQWEQQDALRRLVLNEELKDNDLEQLTDICLDPKVPFEPITQAHVAIDGGSSEPVSLSCIQNPIGVNALAKDQRLEFAKEGLTVIYGDNGSGKSGYVRVLKHACRTRDRGAKILRDIEDTEGTPQSAKIHFSRGKTEIEFD